MTKATEVTIYGTPTCVGCRFMVDQCKRKGISYTYIDVTQDEEALAFIRSYGYNTVPVVYCREEIWSGADMGRVERLIKEYPLQ